MTTQEFQKEFNALRKKRLIDANALFEVASRHHDFFRNATRPTDKARRDEYLQVMCDINDAPTVEAIPLSWLESYSPESYSIYMQAAVDTIIADWRMEQEGK